MAKLLRLMISCDDGGLSQGIDDAIIDLAQEGIVSSVSVMSNMPNASESLQKFKIQDNLEIGAHLNLTEGEPLTSAIQQSSLVRNGQFSGRIQIFLQGLFLANALQTKIYNELDAQMQVFQENKTPVRHITTHHHFHMIPKLRAIVYELARKYDVQWVRNSHLSAASIPFNPFLDRAAKTNNKQTFFEPDFVVLVQEWAQKTPQTFISELEKLDGLIEIVIHPCTKIDHSFPDRILYQPVERYHEIEFFRAFWKLAGANIDLFKTRYSQQATGQADE